MADLPPGVQYGKVVGKIGHVVADSVEDPNSLPDARPATGKVKITPRDTIQVITTPGHEMILTRNPQDVDLSSEGRLIDAHGNDGVWLVVGTYDVSFSGVTGAVTNKLKPIVIEVTAAHTAENPLIMSSFVGAVPPSNGTTQTVQLPPGGNEGDMLVRSGTGFVYVPAPDVTAEDIAAIAVTVTSKGATGGGTTDDTTAINAALAEGGEVVVPPGTYLVDPDYASGRSLRMTVPGTRLRMSPGAVLKAKTNALSAYTVISVEAADCVIEGGTIQGDRATHTGSTGESGHGIAIRGAAHRARLIGVTVKDCWGDGIIVGNDGSLTGARPDDVAIIDCVSDNNRRNNLSLISAVRPVITGGKYLNANGTSPEAGICVEPNANPANQDVTEALFVGVTMAGNAGRGITLAAHDRTVTAKLIGCVAKGNGAEGFGGGGTELAFVGCTADANTGPGFFASSATKPPALSGCTASNNTTFGFSYTTKVNLTSCEARDNGSSGFYFGVAGGLNATGSSGTGLVAVGNNTTSSFYGQITVDGSADVRLTGCVSDVGTNITRPTRGYRLTATATNAVLLSCVTRGSFSSAAYSDIGTGNMALPTPGAAKQTGTPAAATDAATTQSLVNDLRAKLLALGIIA